MNDAEDDRPIEEHDVRDRIADDLLVFESGTAGWDGVEQLVDIDRTADDGVTFLRVTLHRGRDRTKPFKKGEAQGLPVLARLSVNQFAIPERGTEVMVGFPQAFELVAGIGVVVSVMASARAGGQARIVPKGDGSITLMTTTDNTPSGSTVMFRITPTGFMFIAPWGKLIFDETGFHVLTKAGARIDMGGVYGVPAPLDVLTSYVKIQAATIKAEGSSVLLGPDSPTGYQPVAWCIYNPLTPAPAPQALPLVLGVSMQTVSNAVRVAVT